MFAWQPNDADSGPFHNPFAATTRITLAPASRWRVGIEVVAGAKATFLTHEDAESECCSYLWGKAVHPAHRGENLLGWCARKVRNGDLAGLSDMIGAFVILIDDRRNRRVHFLADPMGVRPWFIGKHCGRTVAGASLWPIHHAGLAGPAIDYDSVASWMYYGYDCTGGSLFANYRRLAPGAVITLDGDEILQSDYAHLAGGDAFPPREQVADYIYQQVSESFDLLAEGTDSLAVALSGGYDSRFVAALAARKKEIRCEAFSVRHSEGEVKLASRIAEAIGLPFTPIHTDGSLWNMFSEPFHALPEGFPITKQMSYLVAAQRPGVPTLNGYLGDINIRSTGIREDRRVEFESDETLVPSLTRRRRLWGLRFDLLDSGIERRVEERATAAMRAMISRGRAYDKPFLYTAFYGRQRFYISNNTLQHLDVSEALTPFYRWSLIEQRFRSDYDCFTWETYELLFQRHFPKLAEIPHFDRMGSPVAQSLRPSRATRRWAAMMLAGLRSAECLPVLSRKKAIPRLTGAIMGHREMAPAVLFLYRLFLLETQLQRSGAKLDWRNI